MNVLQRLKNNITAAVTQEVFDSWKPAKQKQYLKEHPNSKFNKDLNKRKAFNSKMTKDDSKKIVKSIQKQNKELKEKLRKNPNNKSAIKQLKNNNTWIKAHKQFQKEPSEEFNKTINNLSKKNYWFKDAHKIAQKAFNKGKINNDEDYEVIEDYTTGLSQSNPKDSYTKSYIKKLQTMLEKYYD